MSSQSIAVLRRGAGADLADLAEAHYKHDLSDSDRQSLESAAKRFSFYTTFGSVAGIALASLLAFRIRSNRTKAFNAFRAAEKPTHVQFSNGRVEPIPDLAPILKPSTLGDVATYLFFGAGGLFLGGELGILAGSASASRSISKDPELKARVENAFRKFKIDALKKQVDALEKGQSGFEF